MSCFTLVYLHVTSCYQLSTCIDVHDDLYLDDYIDFDVAVDVDRDVDIGVDVDGSQGKTSARYDLTCRQW